MLTALILTLNWSAPPVRVCLFDNMFRILADQLSSFGLWLPIWKHWRRNPICYLRWKLHFPDDLVRKISFFLCVSCVLFICILVRYNSVFCETALLEVAIAPKSLYAGMPDVCTNQPASAPSLAGLTSLAQNSTYVLPYATYLVWALYIILFFSFPSTIMQFDLLSYRYVYSGRSQTTILSQQFNVSVDSYIQAQLGSNFLLGDIRILLVSSVNGTTSSSELGMLNWWMCCGECVTLTLL